MPSTRVTQRLHSLLSGFKSPAGAMRMLKRAARLIRPARFKPKRWLRKSLLTLRSLGTRKLRGPKSLAANIRLFANPGPFFEEPDNLDASPLASRAKTIAFYLPQFHAFEENDQWWGKGFTEWRNVSRGTPRFAGHYQPRVPRDLGFYDLNDVEVIKQQSEMAQRNGIDAFCFYYYWFNKKRLMDKPLDLFASADIDQSFCIMWANENWTRTWDGLEQDVLIAQDYLDSDEDAFLADTAQYMAHERYVKVDNKPLFIIYRPGLIPDAAQTMARWKQKWTELLGVTPLIMMVQGFGEENPIRFGLDGAVEFPPHKVCAGLQNINHKCRILDPEFEGLVRDYAEVVDNALNEPAPEFPLIKTVSPSWDNDARREGRGMTIHGSTPSLYSKWLNGAIEFAKENPVHGESLVFINAWNEWAEGAYLEPDVHYGHAYLNATKRVVKGLQNNQSVSNLLLVGHDAHRHGAQMLLLNMAKVLKQQFGINVTVLLLDGGALLPEYRKVTRTLVLNEISWKKLEKTIQRETIEAAICNTTVTGSVLPALKKLGLRTVSLIHEMPNLINEYKLHSAVRSIAQKADNVVFPAELVQNGFCEIAGNVIAKQLIRPQGTYTKIEFDAVSRETVRSSLGVGEHDKIILGVGYADLRKGFDLFMETARRVSRVDPDVHFLWVGALSANMRRWIQTDLAHCSCQSQIHLIDHAQNIGDYYSAADCLFLPSREDPYPTVVLEAMSIGLPVVVYRGVTGFDKLVGQYGYVVTLGDSTETDDAFAHALASGSESQQQARINYIDQECRFDEYCFDLLQLLYPGVQKVSVVVPNYNYEQYLNTRLSSIFAQQYPIFELIVLDDASSDNSVITALACANSANRIINVVQNEHNSSNVFQQWHSGARLARGNRLWIAEADDSATPEFLAQLMAKSGPNTAMCFSDSAQMDSAGSITSKSYRHYYNKIDKALFASSFDINGIRYLQQAMSVRNSIMNVSSVVWDKNRLLHALNELEVELPNYKLVGDWRLYLMVLLQQDVNISFVAESLNYHRRHKSSVTGEIDVHEHLAEIKAMHAILDAQLPLSPQCRAEMAAYIQELSEQFGLTEPAFSEAA